MKITFLGTGTSMGVPVVGCPCPVCHSLDHKDKRLRSSIMIEHGDQLVVIDAGPDFRYQMLREKVEKVDAILITHQHQDHIGGLDDVRSFNFLSGKPMRVYASETDQQRIKEEFSYAFVKNSYPGTPVYDMHTISETPFSIGKLKVEPFVVLHMKMEVTSFRIGDFAYITDVNYIPSDVMAQLLDCKIIVLGALHKSKHLSHFNLYEAIDILNFLRPEKAFITHISHQMGFHNEVEKELPIFIKLAFDGLSFEVN